MIVWYFCDGVALKQFILQGYIPPNDVSGNVGEHVRSVAVCTTNSDGDGLIRRAVLEHGDWRVLKADEFDELCGGFFRIELDEDSAPITWSDWVTKSGITRKEARELYRHIGLSKSDREKLRMTFKPIPKSKWLNVSKMIRGTWRIWNGDTPDTQGSIPLDLILNPGKYS